MSNFDTVDAMQTILETLNDRQREAVLQTHGPLLVMAGAGSGKTKALTHRIAYLIHEKKISPWNILAVTFTNKAANEMKNRIMKIVGAEKESDMPNVGTFHATCVRILRKTIHNLDYENSFVIYDTADQQILMKHVMADLHIDEKTVPPRAILGQISNAKNQLIGPKEFQAFVNNNFTEKVAEAYEHYQRSLKKANALDFDDIIMKTVEIFQGLPQILDQYQEKFRFISIDEYQDTNHAQYILTNLL
ncbi:MAG TPA: UvrD-helicase domain-containing protein, partial [Candidatus Gracilibacteria bacterium]|nr:UvrD-helicase domain-containing protein [Candidatus Gracilibacteria bacterium]